MNKVFSDAAWEQYKYWQMHDGKILKKINSLIKDIERGAFDGIGKPEPLKNELSGLWSRRITEEHRLIYFVDDDNIYIAKCGGHYEKK